MQRRECKWLVSALAALLLTAPAAVGQQKANPQPHVEIVSAAAGFLGGLTTPSPLTLLDRAHGFDPAELDREIVKELIEMLGSTESQTTFAVTAMALGHLGEKAKTAVPAVIRNAERLKIFDGTHGMTRVNEVPGKKQQLANVVGQSLLHMLGGQRAPVVAGRCCWFGQPVTPPVSSHYPPEQ